MNHRTHYEPILAARRSMRRFEAVAFAAKTGAACLLIYVGLVVIMSF